MSLSTDGREPMTSTISTSLTPYLSHIANIDATSAKSEAVLKSSVQPPSVFKKARVLLCRTSRFIWSWKSLT